MFRIIFRHRNLSSSTAASPVTTVRSV
jgi:hypothetical protein